MRAQAIVLAAGRAQRLMPLTDSRPKAMLLVGGRPLLQHSIEALAAHGVQDITVVVGHHGEKIQAFLKDGADFGVAVRYAHQEEPRGTSGALAAALPFLESGGDVLVLSGAVFVSADVLRPLVKAGGDAVAVAAAGDPHDQPIPAVSDGRLTGVRWGPPEVGSTRVLTGLMRLTWDTLEAVAEGADRHREAEEALGARAQEGHEVAVVATKGPWHRLIEPWDVLHLNGHVLDSLPRPDARPSGRASVRGNVWVGKNSHIAASATLIGPVTIGAGCTIGEHTVIGPYVSIRNNSVVGAHCEVRHSVLNNNVMVDSRSLLRGCILDDGAQVAPGFLGVDRPGPRGPVGCILGRDAQVGAGVCAEGGAMVAPETVVPAGERLR